MMKTVMIHSFFRISRKSYEMKVDLAKVGFIVNVDALKISVKICFMFPYEE